MAAYSLNDPNEINHQIKLQECLGDILTKANVLLEFAIDHELLNYQAKIVYPYISAVSDFLQEAAQLQEEILAKTVKTWAANFQGEQHE